MGFLSFSEKDKDRVEMKAENLHVLKDDDALERFDKIRWKFVKCIGVNSSSCLIKY